MADEKDDQPEPLEQVLTFLQSNAVMLHEMFLELQKAGFTTKQALYIIGQAAAAGFLDPDISVDFDDYGEDEEDDTFE